MLFFADLLFRDLRGDLHGQAGDLTLQLVHGLAALELNFAAGLFAHRVGLCLRGGDDLLAGKLALVEQAKAAGTPIICAMGAGNKVDPTAFRVADIYETSVCPLARVMRVQCRKRGIKKLKVVYSQEKPLRPVEDAAISCRNHCICPPGTARKCTDRRDIPGSTAFVPPVVGLIIAGEVVKDLVGEIAAKPAKG